MTSQQVSIALATFNAEAFLDAQLESFNQQSRLPDELVVSDDASTDDTVARVERFKAKARFRVRLVRNSERAGINGNFERALGECTGDIIFLSDQDDIWEPGKIERMLTAFNEDPRLLMVVCDAYYAGPDGVRLDSTVRTNVLKTGALSSGHVAGACSALRRALLDLALPLPSTVPQYDIYLHRWANVLNAKLVLPEVLQSWRIHGANATVANEMANPVLPNTITRFKNSWKAEVSSVYLRKAQEYGAMLEMLKSKREQIESANYLSTLSRLQLLFDAHRNRALVRELGWFSRIGLSLRMLKRGQYRVFKGSRSFARDCLLG